MEQRRGCGWHRTDDAVVDGGQLWKRVRVRVRGGSSVHPWGPGSGDRTGLHLVKGGLRYVVLSGSSFCPGRLGLGSSRLVTRLLPGCVRRGLMLSEGHQPSRGHGVQPPGCGCAMPWEASGDQQPFQGAGKKTGWGIWWATRLQNRPAVLWPVGGFAHRDAQPSTIPVLCQVLQSTQRQIGRSWCGCGSETHYVGHLYCSRLPEAGSHVETETPIQLAGWTRPGLRGTATP